MLYRIMLQIEEGAYNIGAFAMLVGKARGYTLNVAFFYAACFAGMFMMGSIIILKGHLGQ